MPRYTRYMNFYIIITRLLLSPAYWEEIFSAEPGNEITVNISTENALVFVKEETEKFTT